MNGWFRYAPLSTSLIVVLALMAFTLGVLSYKQENRVTCYAVQIETVQVGEVQGQPSQAARSAADTTICFHEVQPQGQPNDGQ